MKNNKLVLDYCPNFYKIINFDYLVDDKITEKLITIYEDYIFDINVEDKKELSRVKELDTAIAKYIDDYIFRKEMKYHLVQVKIYNDEHLLENIVLSIIKIFTDYKEGLTTPIYLSRWI